MSGKTFLWYDIYFTFLEKPHTEHKTGCFIDIISFNLHNNSVRYILLSSLFYICIYIKQTKRGQRFAQVQIASEKSHWKSVLGLQDSKVQAFNYYPIFYFMMLFYSKF